MKIPIIFQSQIFQLYRMLVSQALLTLWYTTNGTFPTHQSQNPTITGKRLQFYLCNIWQIPRQFHLSIKY